MRGKGLCFCHENTSFGITPAYAGKRQRFSRGQKSPWDHPRVCGEKYCNRPAQARPLGSPPRMRGKEVAAKVAASKNGITPAYAGKRAISNTEFWIQRDHPRVCGEKLLHLFIQPSRPGSPPRMRGKARRVSVAASTARITPAYAGKRRQLRVLVYPSWDHPRVCGEKSFHSLEESALPGSPPRMRGKD